MFTMDYVCRVTDTSRQTIRLYEREGLIEVARASNGTRIFHDANIDRIREIRASRKAGRPRKAQP